jgi:hypothetical protein
MNTARTPKATRVRSIKYWVFNPATQLFVAEVKAKSEEEAAALAQAFGPGCKARKYSDVKGSWDVGFDTFWTKDSAKGRWYRCKVCDKDNLGRGSHNHYTHCPLSNGGAS